MAAGIEQKSEEIDLDFLQLDLPKMFNSMKAGTDRIRNIILFLRNFSRVDEAEFKSVQLCEGIKSTLLILEPVDFTEISLSSALIGLDNLERSTL